MLLRLYCDDIPDADLHALVRRTYTAQTFGSDDIVPVRTLEPDLHLLRLSNGPTLAFKDVAMQLLGHLFEYVLAKDGRELNILGATSGDTGSAAEYAMRGRRGIRVFMLSPAGRMSPFQTAQMFSLRDANIFNIAVDGVFDDCQDMVKAVSADLRFKARHAIGTVNSINWARVVAQVVYYFKAWFAVTATSGPREVSFTVPSGNFGNVLAGHIARRMGLPIRRLVVATNENDVLDEFFRTGVYGRAAPPTRMPPAARRWTSRRRRTSSASSGTGRPGRGAHRGALARGRRPRLLRPRRHARVRARGGVRLRVGGELARAAPADHPRDRGPLRRRRRHPHRRRPRGRAALARAGRADGLPRDRAAGKFAETIARALGRDPERPAAYAASRRTRSATRGCRPTSRCSSATSPSARRRSRPRRRPPERCRRA